MTDKITLKEVVKWGSKHSDEFKIIHANYPQQEYCVLPVRYRDWLIERGGEIICTQCKGEKTILGPNIDAESWDEEILCPNCGGSGKEHER